MPATWNEVAESPDFKQLLPAAQDQARQQYFSEVIEPKARAEKADIDEVRDQFFKSTGGPITPDTEKAIAGPQTGFDAGRHMDTDARVGHLMDDVLKRTKGADYTSGTGFGTRYNLRARDTKDERLGYLQKKYGEGNVQTDPGGRFLVLQNGKWTEAEGFAPASDMVAGIAANPLESIGMVAGAALPEVTFARLGLSGPAMAQKATKLIGPMLGYDVDFGKLGLSMLRGGTRAAGAGVGGGVGATLDPLVTGRDLTETGQRFRDAAIRNFEGDLAFGALTKPFRSGVYPFLEDQVRRDVANKIIDRGYIPPLSQISSVSKTLPRVQMIGTQAFGFPAADKNIALLNKDMRATVKALGLTDEQADAEVRKAMAAGGGTADLAVDVGGAIKGREAGLAREVADREGRVAAEASIPPKAADDQVRYAEKALTDQLRRVDHLLGAPGNVFEDVQGAIRDGRAKSAQAISPIYDEVDKASGLKVDRSRINDWANGELKKLETGPKDYTGAPPALVKMLQSIAAGPKDATFGQMNNLRKNLMQAGWSDELNHANAQRILMNGSHTVTDMLYEQEEKAGIKEANTALKKANKAWSSMMDQYDDRLLDQLVKSPSDAGAIDPSKLADVVFKPKQVDRAERVLRVLPEQQQRQLKASFVDKVMTTVTKDDGSVDLKKLNGLIGAGPRSYGGVVDVVLGKEEATATRKAVTDLIKAHASIDKADLIGATPQSLERLAKAQGDWNAYMANNVAHEISKPSFEGERAIDWLLNKDVTQRVKDFRKLYPPDTPEFQKLQLGFYRKIFGELKGTDSHDARKLILAFDGPAAMAELNSYAPGMAEEVLGASRAQALRDNLDVWSHVFPGATSDIQAGLAGGGQAEHLFANLIHAPIHLVGTLGLYQLMTWPGFMRWSVAGMRGDDTALAIATKIGKGALSGASQGTRDYDDAGQGPAKGQNRPQ